MLRHAATQCLASSMQRAACTGSCQYAVLAPTLSQVLQQLPADQSPPCWARILWLRWHTADAHHHRDERHLKHCWSCDFNVQKGGLVCHACDKLQPVETGANYFDLFGIEEGFDVAPAELERKYKSLQWQVHPDKTINRPPKEQLYSAQQAALINHAYSILRSPLARANYLLLRMGAARAEDAELTIPDSELLSQVLEMREEIEETSDEQRLRELLAGVRAQEADLVAQLSAAFARPDVQAAKDAVLHLSYISKLVDAIVQKLP